MAFNPFNLFKGNPKVLELMGSNSSIDQLLLEEAFLSQFKKSDNEPLQKYMNYEKYEQLITFITVVEKSSDKNRGYKFPYAASQILSVNNEITFSFLLQETVFSEQIVEEEVQIEKEIDSQSSDRSYSSIKSNNSSTGKKEFHQSKSYEQADKQNFILREEGDKTLFDYDFKDEKDICEQDFPNVKQKKVVVVLEMIKKTVKKPLQPLIFPLLRYFQNSNVIHILDGYVCRVLDNIVNNRLQDFLKIVENYGAINSIKRIFSHLQSTSVQETILNFMCKIQESEDTLVLSDGILFLDFIQRICQISYGEWPSNEVVLDEKSYLINLYCGVIEKMNGKMSVKAGLEDKAQEKKEKKDIKGVLKELKAVINSSHLQKIIEIINQGSKAKESLVFSRVLLAYYKLIKYLLKSYILVRYLDCNKCLQSQEARLARQMNESCEQCFDPLIKITYRFVLEDIPHLEKSQLGEYKFENPLSAKIELLQILAILSKQNIYFSRRSIIDHPSFQLLMRMLDLYPKSSILHNHILGIIMPFLTPDNEVKLVDKLFTKKQFLSFLFETVKHDSQLRYQRKDRNRKCYIAQIKTICLALDRLDSHHFQALNAYKQDYEWKFIRECLLEDQKSAHKKLLGGHQKARDKKPLIFFSKEECLENFKYFLSGLKLNVLDDFQNFEPGNSDSEEEEVGESKPYEPSFSTEGESGIAQDDSKYFAEDYIL